ncbi:MAG: hypothetical protein OEM39_00525 [Acidimicrobiia bacterium]|nr:hypothetical protein [Acidimicrobiia bacterium]
MTDVRTLGALESSDTDELLRIVDGHCKARDWDVLEELRLRCQEAVTRGKQLWGVDEHIRYRLALEAPAAQAAKVLDEGRARFTLGPLPEVAASTKTWRELAPYMGHGPERRTVVAERVIRGEVVDEEFDLPGLQEWEPKYAVATYKSHEVETPQPKLPGLTIAELPQDPKIFEDPDSEAALTDLVEPWVDQSNGRSQTTSVEGDVLAAVSALGLRGALIAELSPQQAMAQMAWAAASGGAHGERRGAAAGRYLAWWVVSTLADLDWPSPARAVGEACQRMKWLWFDDSSPEGGWALRIAVSDPDLGLAWALSATDVAD